MAKRIVDGEALWHSDKLLRVSEKYRSEYANLLPLGDTEGSFECAPRRIWALVYSYNRPNISPEEVGEMLDQFESAKMVFRWQANGKTWGHFVGATKQGRLPAASRKYGEPCAPPVPQDELQTFLAEKELSSPHQQLAAYGERTASVRLPYHGNGTGIGSATGKELGIGAPSTVDNSGSHSRFNGQNNNSNSTGTGTSEVTAATLLVRFHDLVSKNPHAEYVPDNWEHLWGSDIEQMLERYSGADAARIVEESQSKRWARYTVRAAALLNNSAKIAKQLGIAERPMEDAPEPERQLPEQSSSEEEDEDFS